MRLIAVSLFALLLLIQYPLWMGRGGWMHVWKADSDVEASRGNNNALRVRNARLQSEVDDLKNGTGAIEERARVDLGMIKKDEIFVRILNADATIPPETSYEKMIHAAMPKSTGKEDDD